MGNFKTENKLLANLIFVVLMIFSSCTSFSSILTILRAVIELQDNPRRYSFFTVMMTNMWDTTLCLLCFILAFKDQVSVNLCSFPWCFTSFLPLSTVFSSQIFNRGSFWVSINHSWKMMLISEEHSASSICTIMAVFLPYILFSYWPTSTGFSSSWWAASFFLRSMPTGSIITDLTCPQCTTLSTCSVDSCS